MHLYKWIQNWQAGESLLHAFSAFLLLSYTKFALTSSYIVNLHPILGADGSQIGPRRAYYAGQFTEHDVIYVWRYYVPSCLVIVIIGVIPIMLLWYPIIWLEKFICKVDWLWRLYPVTKIHVFMDTFQGCYRDDRRFFAAMYFLFRLTINVGYILTDNWLAQFVVQQIACTVFIVIFVLCWPYREENWLFNYVDFLMLTNLAIVNALSLYLFAFSQNNHGLSLPNSAFWVQYILVFMPLVYMIIYVAWCLLTPSQKKRISKFFSKYAKPKAKRNCRQKRIVHQTSTPYGAPSSVAVDTTSNGEIDSRNAQNDDFTVRPTIVTSSDMDFIDYNSFVGSDSDEEEAMLARACDRNRYKPPTLRTDGKTLLKRPTMQQRYIERDFTVEDECEATSSKVHLGESCGDFHPQNPTQRRVTIDYPHISSGKHRDHDEVITTKDSGFASQVH